MICRNLSASANPNFFTTLLCKSFSLNQLNQIQAQIIVNGFQNNLITATKLTHKFSDLGAIDQARSLFSTIAEPDLFLCNVLLRSFSHNNSSISAIKFYSDLRRKAFKPDNFTLSFSINAASALSSLQIGRQIHAHSICNGFESDRFVGSAIIDLYLKVSQIQTARQVFDRISEPDTVCWNTMISGLVWNSCFRESLQVFQQMILLGTQFDSTTLAAVLPATSELQALKIGMKIHCFAVKKGLQSQVHIVTGLISMYSKCGEISIASVLFREIPEPDLISYNAMISGYSFNGDIQSSLLLFKNLQISVKEINSSTIVGLIPVFSPFEHLQLSNSIHGFCIKSGFDSNSSVATALTTVYARCNDIETARQLFDKMPERTLASWNAMISGYAQNGLTENAVSLFREMQMQRIQPNPVTITSILSACAQLGALTLGKWIHDLTIRNSFQTNIFVSTALIDMYAKCGSIGESRRIFDEMPEKNVVSWNAMISGHGLHGQGHEALKLLSEMLNSGIAPTGVTLLSVLHACSHAGLVSEGHWVFRFMTGDFGILPSPEHYACMVDLLGRAGRFEEAVKFIETEVMPHEPMPGVWGALLGSCMIHRDTELAKWAAERLFKSEPDNAGYHVLLSNIYSTSRNWQEAAGIREMAKQRKLAKTPGCSLIELGEMLHIFKAGDRLHPRTDEIYVMLEKLDGKVMEAGFQPEVSFALHDVEEEEKEGMVKVHSEKLAIAFGLTATEPGTEIRIIKNLRVCVDCHSWTKFVSMISERVIVVRDANRFHHFRHGVCSCGDYW